VSTPGDRALAGEAARRSRERIRRGSGREEADAALARLAAGDGSEAAFETALGELARLVRGYLVFEGVDPDDLEDLAQEAIVRAYTARHRRRGDTVASLRAWLRVICRNLSRSARGREKRGTRPGPAGPRERAPSTLAAATPASGPPPSVEPAEVLDLREALRTCLGRLREPDRTVVALRYLRELDTREIAELYGWKRRNCEHVLARARGSLERQLRREGFEP